MSCRSANGQPIVRPWLWCMARSWACVLLLAAVVLPAPQAAQAQANTTSGEVLLAFKAGITNWDAVTSTFQGWADPSQTACSWTGVQCDANNDVTDM